MLQSMHWCGRVATSNGTGFMYTSTVTHVSHRQFEDRVTSVWVAKILIYAGAVLTVTNTQNTSLLSRVSLLHNSKSVVITSLLPSGVARLKWCVSRQFVWVAVIRGFLSVGTRRTEGATLLWGFRGFSPDKFWKVKAEWCNLEVFVALYSCQNQITKCTLCHEKHLNIYIYIYVKWFSCW